MLQPIEGVNNSKNKNSSDSFDEYLEASFNAPEQRINEQPEHYTSNINDAEIDRLSNLSDDDIYDWDVPEASAPIVKETGRICTDGTDLHHADDDNMDSGKHVTGDLVAAEYIPDPIETALKALEVDPSDESAYYRITSEIATLPVGNAIKTTEAIEKIKKITGINKGDIQADIKAIRKDLNAKPEPLTHFDMATQYVKKIGVDDFIADESKFFIYSDESKLWGERDINKVECAIAKEFNEENNCKKGSDYKQIGGVTYSLAEQKNFFESAPFGVNTPSGFARINDGKIVIEAPTKEHRQRFKLDVNPMRANTPLWNMLMSTAFCDTQSEQEELFLQAAGVSLFGLMPSMQTSMLMYGIGGAGKSVLLAILGALIPSTACASIGLGQLSDPNHVAALAGKRFNLVPEADKDSFVPDAIFKTLTSGERLTTRVAFGQTFSFLPVAANWFNTNHLPRTKDNSEGFFRRWRVLHFKYKVSEANKIVGLEEKIIANELPGILHKIFEATERHLKTGKWPESKAHNEIMEHWRGRSNTVKQWLGDQFFCEIDGAHVGLMERKKRSKISATTINHLYKHYTSFCGDNGISRPVQKGTFMETLGELGHTCNSKRFVASLALVPYSNVEERELESA